MKTKIQYELEKGKVKNIYIRIREGKVLVKAPYFVTKKQIDKMIEEKEGLLISSLEKEKIRRQKEIEEKKKMPRNMDEFLKSVKTTFEKYTKMTSIYPNKIRVKELNYAWGSCTSKKNITINSKLAIRTKEELEYVVLHELCHIKHMNHSKEFWKLVESYMPEYKQVKKKLKE